MDENTVVLSAKQVPWRQATGLMKHFKNLITSLTTTFRLELWLSLVLCQAYYKRIDLQITGRTVMGMVDSSKIAAMCKCKAFSGGNPKLLQFLQHPFSLFIQTLKTFDVRSP